MAGVMADEDELQTRLGAHDPDALGCNCGLCNDENGPRPREGDGSLLQLEGHLGILTQCSILEACGSSR